MTQQQQQLQPGQQAAADTPQPVMLTPDQAVEQLLAFITQVPVEQELTAQERKALRRSLRLSDTVVQASFSVIDASDTLSQAVAKPGEARQLIGDSNLWTTFENVLRGALQRVADANIVRRQRARLIASQAYVIGKELVRNPENAGLKPHVEEVKRLRSIARRKKPATPAPQTPAPSADAPAATGTSASSDDAAMKDK